MSVMGIALSLVALALQMAVVVAWVLLLVGSIRAFQRRQWVRGVIWGSLFLVLLVLFLLPSPTKSQKSSRSKCRNNLAQLSKSMVMYSMDYGDAFPTNLQGLIPCGANRPGLFVCPSSGHSHGELANVEEWTDYVFVLGVRVEDGSGCVLAFCPPENHGGKGGNVLFADGSVEWRNADEFVAMTNNPAKFFGTPDTNKLAEIKKRVRILRAKKQIRK